MINKIINAIYLTFENAKSLYEDAEILEERSKFGRAYTLFHLCFEECGRFNILYNLFQGYLSDEIKPKDINYGRLKRLGYEDHNTKISESFNRIYQTSFVFLMIAKDQNNDIEFKNKLDNKIEELHSMIEGLREYESDMNRLKNVGLYVTFNNNNFNLPDKTITVTEFLRIKEFAHLGLESLERIIEFADSKGGFREFKRLISEGE